MDHRMGEIAFTFAPSSFAPMLLMPTGDDVFECIWVGVHRAREFGGEVATADLIKADRCVLVR